MKIDEIYKEFEPSAKKIISYLNVPECYAGDILSEFYLKLYKMQEKDKLDILYTDNKLNESYLFVVIRNLVSDFRKSESTYTDEIDLEYKVENELEEEIQLKQDLAKYYINKIPEFFDRQLLTLYINEDKSMRKLSKATRISLDTIYKSLKYSKGFVKESVNADIKKMKKNEC